MSLLSDFRLSSGHIFQCPECGHMPNTTEIGEGASSYVSCPECGASDNKRDNRAFLIGMGVIGVMLLLRWLGVIDFPN